MTAALILLGPGPGQVAPDAAIFETLWAAEGAVQLSWEQATRCSCYSPDSRQPQRGHADCGGTGVLYAAAQTITGLFRGQGRWQGFDPTGELAHGDASLSTPVAVKPGYVDRRVRDRFTVLQAAGDTAEGRVFLPAGPATPFFFVNVQHAWRVQLQSMTTSQRLSP